MSTILGSRTVACIEVLADALGDRGIPKGVPRAEGALASSEEGLAIVASFLAISESRHRQALLDLAAALATSTY